ncbi:AN1-type zinc finger protein 2A isoform X1 [Leucoraja erinacea]|uniref:AN1-type zinc finger protein 2A isoform X1 n=1 Tax=Leucoraja erinaceus TaxID=7782 RepID=UPI002458E1DD|nr:AN1-type zinc finger protein 2A isoform X1 [Leucoraja erinacea]
MEFPDLGEHCSESSCKRLDFLPMKCDACAQIFCKDHISYVHHQCTSSYKKDVQVPMCPLCSMPVPVKRGEMPDIRVSEHIDRECKSDPAQKKRKIFTNKCSSPGCKQKEMIKVTCDQCHLNFCLKHRHPLDHVCAADGKPLSKPGNAAVIRARGNPKPSATPSTSKDTSSSRPNRLNTSAAPLYKSDLPRSIPTSASLQAGLTEEQALQSALERSLAESSRNTAPSRQEQEDLALAQAIAASEEEFRRQQQQTQHRSSRSLPCKLS